MEEKSPGILSTLKVLPADIKAVNATASLFVKSLLLGIDHSLQKKEKSAKFDDTIDFDDIEILPFEEALEYMKKRLPISAEEYYKLSDKARFRAFTVARLNDGDSLKKAKSLLEKSIAEGGTLSEFLKKTDTELLTELGLAGTNGGWYWENVYRTNVQTAYNTGRAIGFENVKPLALELVGIGDSRQTELCRSLTQPPVRRPYGDEFWERYWPPLHFSCRTTVRAIYDPAELEEEPITNIPDGIEKHRAKGFGSYPIDSDTWWDELPSMKRRAVAYGVQGEIEKVKGKLKLSPEIINFEKNDVLSIYATKIPQEEGYFDVALHGTQKFVIYDGKEISWRELGEIIKHNKNFTRQKGIRLLSCNTGNGKDCFAQNLANYLNCKVKAPNDTLYIWSDGKMTIGGLFNTGRWIIFVPGGEK